MTFCGAAAEWYLHTFIQLQLCFIHDYALQTNNIYNVRNGRIKEREHVVDGGNLFTSHLPVV